MAPRGVALPWASCAPCSPRAAEGGAQACRSSVCPGPRGAIAFGLRTSKWGPFRLGVHGSLCEGVWTSVQAWRITEDPGAEDPPCRRLPGAWGLVALRRG